MVAASSAFGLVIVSRREADKRDEEKESERIHVVIAEDAENAVDEERKIECRAIVMGLSTNCSHPAGRRFLPAVKVYGTRL